MDDRNIAIDLNLEFSGAYENRGFIYNKLGNHQQALSEFIMAIKINPKSAPAYMGRGAIV